MLNYEVEVEEILLENLKSKYGITDEKMLYLYLKLRYYFIFKTDNIEDKKQFINFILSELNIVDYQYKDITFTTYTSSENSYSNIIENFEYELYGRLHRDNLNNEILDMYKIEQNYINIIKDYSSKKSKKITKDIFQDKYILFYQLEKLNELFQVNKINEVKTLKYFNQEDKISLEMELDRYIKSSLINTSNLNTITETDLEKFLIKNLNLIEPNLRYIDRQYQLEEGRIDILAKDKNNQIVIIELKIAADKKLIWQCLYYPKEIAKKTNSKIRMIAIAPNYPSYLLDILKDINVELYSYDIKISNHKIEELKLKKI